MSSMSWSGMSYKDNLTKSALTTGAFLTLDKMYNHSPVDLKKGALSFGASYLSEAGSNWAYPFLFQAGSQAEANYLAQPLLKMW